MLSALARFERHSTPWSGSTDEDSAGNGSIMRLAPVPLFFANDPEGAIAHAGDSSRTTHGAREALDACRYMAGLIIGALQDNFVSYRVNEDYEKYIQELVAEWGYSEELARLLNRSVMSWMAVPLFDPVRRRVEAVLYVDSTERHCFTETRQDLRETKVAAG